MSDTVHSNTTNGRPDVPGVVMPPLRRMISDSLRPVMVLGGFEVSLRTKEQGMKRLIPNGETSDGREGRTR